MAGLGCRGLGFRVWGFRGLGFRGLGSLRSLKPLMAMGFNGLSGPTFRPLCEFHEMRRGNLRGRHRKSHAKHGS